MTSRERVNAVLKREKPDRVPFNFWMDRWRMEELDQRLGGGSDFRTAYYGVDVVESIPPVNWFPTIERHTYTNKQSTWRTNSVITNPQTLLHVPYNTTKITTICESIQKDRKKYPDKAIFALFCHHFDIILNVRIMQDFFLDLYDYPETILELCTALSDELSTIITTVCRSTDIDAIYLAGDLGSKNGPLIAPQDARRFWLPGMRKCVQAAHDQNTPVLLHSCGRVIELLDIFAESGIDGINPLQASVNGDDEYLPWLDRFIVYGGIDNSFIIPEGPVERIRRHIRTKFKALGRQGNLILSSHDIQGDTPLEHIDAMVAEIKKCRYC